MMGIMTAFQKDKVPTRWKKSSLMVLSRVTRLIQDWIIKLLVMSKYCVIIRIRWKRLPRRDETASREANPNSQLNNLSYLTSLNVASPRVSKDFQNIARRNQVLTTSLILSPGLLLPINIILGFRRRLRRKRNRLALTPSQNWRMILVLPLLGGPPSLCLKERCLWAKQVNSQMDHPFLARLLRDRLLYRSKIRSRKLVNWENSSYRLNINLKVAECSTRWPMDNNFHPNNILRINKGWAISQKLTMMNSDTRRHNLLLGAKTRYLLVILLFVIMLTLNQLARFLSVFLAKTQVSWDLIREKLLYYRTQLLKIT